MRVLNTSTLELVDNLQEGEHYAILSHRWGGEEVAYKDYCLVRKDARYSDQQRAERPWLEERAEKAREIRARSGYQKIVKLCSFARKQRVEWAWIDSKIETRP